MTEAARAVVTWRFDVADDDMRSSYMIDNPRSANVLTKLGFQQTDMKRRFCHFRGEDVDIQNMVLTKAAWQATLAANPINPAPVEGPLTSLR